MTALEQLLLYVASFRECIRVFWVDFRFVLDQGTESLGVILHMGISLLNRLGIFFSSFLISVYSFTRISRT